VVKYPRGSTKKVAFAICLGLLTIPLTYSTSRSGKIAISVALFFVAGYLSSFLSKKAEAPESPTLLEICAGFTFGVAIAQSISFLNYFSSYGREDQKLGVGVWVMAIEFGIAVFVGSVGIVVSRLIHRT
jgi:hypothetical protein